MKTALKIILAFSAPALVGIALAICAILVNRCS
jgi:hypothetical protein